MTKPCSKCGVQKPFSDFNLTRNECKVCHSALMSAAYHERRHRQTRVCNTCGVEKGLLEFNVSHHTCKPCRTEKRRIRAQKSAGMSGREKLNPLDLVACPVCSLRGHEPGDPDRCRQPLRSTGMGQQLWVGRGLD